MRNKWTENPNSNKIVNWWRFFLNPVLYPFDTKSQNPVIRRIQFGAKNILYENQQEKKITNSGKNGVENIKHEVCFYKNSETQHSLHKIRNNFFTTNCVRNIFNLSYIWDKYIIHYYKIPWAWLHQWSKVTFVLCFRLCPKGAFSLFTIEIVGETPNSRLVSGKKITL